MGRKFMLVRLTMQSMFVFLFLHDLTGWVIQLALPLFWILFLSRDVNFFNRLTLRSPVRYTIFENKRKSLLYGGIPTRRHHCRYRLRELTFYRLHFPLTLLSGTFAHFRRLQTEYIAYCKVSEIRMQDWLHRLTA